jgi:hypothetical protein
MHQDIKTFSDALAINGLPLVVSITVKIHGSVVGYVELNGTRCVPGVNQFTLNLLDKIEVVSTITQFEEGTSAIEITDLTVNGYNVIPTYQHHSSTTNAYHDFVGTWKLKIPSTFYVWYHKASGQGWVA